MSDDTNILPKAPAEGKNYGGKYTDAPDAAGSGAMRSCATSQSSSIRIPEIPPASKSSSTDPTRARNNRAPDRRPGRETGGCRMKRSGGCRMKIKPLHSPTSGGKILLVKAMTGRVSRITRVQREAAAESASADAGRRPPPSGTNPARVAASNAMK